MRSSQDTRHETAAFLLPRLPADISFQSVSTMAGKLTTYAVQQMLQLAIANMPALTVHLASSWFDPDQISGVSSFLEADYPGYAAQVLVFSALESQQPHSPSIADFVSLTFTCTGNSVPNQIYGFWLQDSVSNVWGYELFTGSPRPMTVNGQTVQVRIRMRQWSPT
jgi:hypothetical protein